MLNSGYDSYYSQTEFSIVLEPESFFTLRPRSSEP